MVKCECCGIEEDCTQTYITKIRESHSGKWVCGLCSEVMKETSERAPGRTVDQAMSSHRAICQEFNSTRLNPKLSLASAMKNLAKRVSENRAKSAPLLLFRAVSPGLISTPSEASLVHMNPRSLFGVLCPSLKVIYSVQSFIHVLLCSDLCINNVKHMHTPLQESNDNVSITGSTKFLHRLNLLDP